MILITFNWKNKSGFETHINNTKPHLTPLQTPPATVNNHHHLGRLRVMTSTTTSTTPNNHHCPSSIILHFNKTLKITKRHCPSFPTVEGGHRINRHPQSLVVVALEREEVTTAQEGDSGDGDNTRQWGVVAQENEGGGSTRRWWCDVVGEVRWLWGLEGVIFNSNPLMQMGLRKGVRMEFIYGFGKLLKTDITFINPTP